jgi:hypothetical protein
LATLLQVRWERIKPGFRRYKLRAVHKNHCDCLERPEVVLHQPPGTGARIVVPKLPLLRVCCLPNPAVRTQWWYDVAKTTERVEAGVRDALFETLATKVLQPNDEDDEVWWAYTCWERRARSREVLDLSERDRQLERAVAAARAKYRGRDVLWDAAEKAWEEAAAFGTAGRRMEFLAASGQAFRLARQAEEQETVCGRPSVQTLHGWRRTVARWQKEAQAVRRGARRAQAAPGAKREGERHDIVTLDELRAARLLGVDVYCRGEELRAAYRARSFEHHPDRGGSHEQMVAVNAAYGVLSARLARAAAA